MKLSLCPNCKSRHDPTGIVFDYSRLTISWPGGSIYLTRTQMDVMSILLDSPGRPVRVEFMTEGLWRGHDYRCQRVNLRVQVCKMRMRLKKAGFPGSIITVRGTAYELALHQRAEAAA